MNETPDQPKIIEALETSPFRWRTLNGIARDSGLPRDRVTQVLDSTGLVVRARKPNAHGESLFALRAKLSKEDSLGRRITAAILNRPE